MSDTPSAVLRQAAARLREMAGKATPNICPDWTRSAMRHVARNCDIDCLHEVEGGGWVDAQGVNHAGWERYDDAPWYIAMGPAIAEPLAAQWLALADAWDVQLAAESVNVCIHVAVVAAVESAHLILGATDDD